MISVTQLTQTLRQILEEEANELAKETGFIQRERRISGADFAQTLIFGWLQDPQVTLDGMTQIAQRREVEITSSGWCQPLAVISTSRRCAICVKPSKVISGSSNQPKMSVWAKSAPVTMRSRSMKPVALASWLASSSRI